MPTENAETLVSFSFTDIEVFPIANDSRVKANVLAVVNGAIKVNGLKVIETESGLDISCSDDGKAIFAHLRGQLVDAYLDKIRKIAKN